MKAQKLTRTQRLNINMTQAWDFFSSPHNLAHITPAWLDFRVMSDVPDKMYEGMIIQYNVHPFLHLPIWWVTEITHIKEPYFFVDEQRKGPYAMWHHEHHFKEDKNGVLMTDIVHYILPFSSVVQPAAGWFIGMKLNSIFDFRYMRLDKMFNA